MRFLKTIIQIKHIRGHRPMRFLWVHPTESATFVVFADIPSFRDEKILGKNGFTLRGLGFGIKIVVLAETALFIGSYLLWRKMNRDRDFRFTLHQKMPYVLEYYYTIGEKLGSQSARESDYTAWNMKQ
uniref:Uncharacterized protein n=1 Tax=Arion vulgaris TaxID=1028688 RepID=A0A0B7A7Q4_9EUPU